ncbi:MAG: DUF4838 domain-containing protein [Clostridia bacterium]|nr:DUF4838 domain-containing protein [Clostridia bacterium]
MKKTVAVLLALLMLAGALVPAAYAKGDVMIDAGSTVVAGEESLLPAAEKLAYYIGNVCGAEPAVTQGGPGDGEVYLGVDPAVGNGFVIEETGGAVSVTGSDLAMAVRGVYAFLERYAGVRCYTSALTKCEKSEVVVPTGEKYVWTPTFEYTDTDWLSPRNTEYSLFNGLNGGQYRTIPAEFGGTVDYISSFGHSLTNQFCSKGKYFESHPEYFAYYLGKRTDQQLCLSNPEVLRIVKEEVFDLLREKHDPSLPLQIVSLTQADNIAFCTCSECRRIDRQYGSHAGTMLTFVNEIARAVKEAGYDNVAIDTFAYRYTRTPPQGIAPEDNVIVRLCTIECCFSHPFDDPTCKTNAEFMKDLAGWSAICRRLYIWDYCTDYSAFVGIFPDFGTLQRNMQIFAENNVRGVYEEGNYTMQAETEFGELRSYLIGRLMLDPYTDLESERDAFLNAYYGAGGEYLAEFLDIVTERAGKKHLGIYEFQSNILSLDRNGIARCDELWQKAKDATQGEENANVRASELCWRYWKMKNRASEFASPVGYKAEKQKLTDDINEKTTRWAEVGEKEAFRNSLFQYLYFKAYRLVKAVLDLLYAVR